MDYGEFKDFLESGKIVSLLRVKVWVRVRVRCGCITAQLTLIFMRLGIELGLKHVRVRLVKLARSSIRRYRVRVIVFES
jgi:hypothetical protein